MNPHLELIARAAAELAVMFEMCYGPQDRPEHFLRANPEGATLLFELHDRLVESRVAVPDEVSFLVSHLPRKN